MDAQEFLDQMQLKSKRVPFKRVEPTPAQRKAWVETKTVLLWSVPALSTVFFDMMTNNGKDEVYWTNEVDVAATDDATMFLNPEAFCKYSLEERVLIACHEIMHAIFAHCGQSYALRARGSVKMLDGSYIKYDDATMGRAQDYIINASLVNGKIGKMPKDGLYDPKISNGTESMPVVYKRVYEDKQGGGGGGTSGGKGGFDQHLDPGTGKGDTPQEAMGNRNEQEWKMSVQAGMAAAKAQGKLPGSLQMVLQEIIAPQVDWTEHVRMLMGRKIGNSRSSWDHLDEQLVVRGIGAPGRVGHGCDVIAVGYDSSGSLYDSKTLQVLMNEVAGMIDELRPKRLVLIQCDYHVQEVRECYDSSELQEVEVKGGGGTSFVPVFEVIDKEYDGSIDALIYLTDGEGRFPNEAPVYPVIWGNVSPPGKIRYPFGDVVDIPLNT